MNGKKVAVLLLVLLLLLQGAGILYEETRTCRLPVLMYHHFDQSSAEDTVVSVRRFREQMTALKEAGFTAVTLGQILDYVDRGTPLPKRAVLITMDDGYTSNLELAAPILEELGLCATVFVIGVNEGQEVYAHSGEPLTPPRFSYEEAAPWVEKGVLDLQCHSYDMHQLKSYGFSGRDGMLPLEGEDGAAYAESLRADLAAFLARREGRVDTDLTALAYPFGFYEKRTDQLLAEYGIRLTFTVEERNNRLVIGDPGCLLGLGRYNVTDRISGKELVQKLLK